MALIDHTHDSGRINGVAKLLRWTNSEDFSKRVARSMLVATTFVAIGLAVFIVVRALI